MIGLRGSLLARPVSDHSAPSGDDVFVARWQRRPPSIGHRVGEMDEPEPRPAGLGGLSYCSVAEW